MMKKISLLALSLLTVASGALHSNQVHAQAGPGGGGSSNSQTCAASPVQLDLTGDLAVQNINGTQAVVVDWGFNEQGVDLNLDQKVSTFTDYLETDPTLGDSDVKLKMAFADHIYDAIQTTDNRLVQDTFYESLAEGFQDQNFLDDQNLGNVYEGYYLYMLEEELRTNKELKEVFMTGFSNGLTEGDETINAEKLLGAIGVSLEKVQGNSNAKEAASCISRVVGSAGVTDFAPGSDNSVYGDMDDRMQAALDSVKEDGIAEAVIQSLKNDQVLIAQSQESLEIGVNTLMNTWASNGNVQNLIDLYKTDANVQNLTQTFFETDMGQELSQCVREAYRGDILDKGVYNEQVADAVIEAFLNENLDTSPLNDSDVYDQARLTVMSFINSYLYLEDTVGQVTNADTPFNDFYRSELSSEFKYVDDMTISIYRDGDLIQTLDNQNLTHYIDTDFPVNNSDEVKTHEYQIVTKTTCDEVTGDVGEASINPVVEAGTAVQASANVDLRLRESNSQFFMDCLHILLNLLIDEDAEIETVLKEHTDSIEDKVLCDTSRDAFLAKKTSASLFTYALDCFGDNQINYALSEDMKEIAAPLIQMLEINEFANMDQITSQFLEEVIVSAQDQYVMGTEVVSAIEALKPNAVNLLAVSDIDSFTDEQKDLIVCGGDPDCAQDIQDLITNHLSNASHTAAIEITVYDQNKKLVASAQTVTDIFGRAEAIDIGELKAGENYELRVSLLGEPYALSKVSQITLNNAEPNDGQYVASIDLESKTPFVFGNFNNVDNEITIEDLEIWLDLIENEPEKWSAVNIDGSINSGPDALDLALLQSNWGEQAPIQAVVSDGIQLTELLDVFGQGESATNIDSDNDGLSDMQEYTSKNSSTVDVPMWLLNVMNN